MNKILSNWYKGECRAPGLFSEEQSESICISETIEDAEEEPDLDLAYDELESIKQGLLQLRGKLIMTTTDPCELQVPSPLEDATFLTSKQLLLLQLRRSNCLLRCQLHKQAEHLLATRREMKLLEAQRCQLRNRINKMTEELDNFERFKQLAIHHFGICIERNEQIKASKVYEKDFTTAIRRMSNHSDRRMINLTPMRCHQQLHYDLSVELILLRIFLHTLFGSMMDDWNYCKRRLIFKKNWGCSYTMMPPPTGDSMKPWPLRD